MTTSNVWTVQRRYHRDPNADMGRMDCYPEGKQITLITPAELATLEHGTLLYDIFGFPATVGVDEIDMDSRAGYLAYGLPIE
jgi:hypothetical protein